MRKILMFTRNGAAALRTAVRQTRLVAFGASLAVTLYGSYHATAQTPTAFVAPAAAMDYQGAPVSGSSQMSTETVSDASYSVLSDTTHTEPAAFLGGIGNPGGGGFFPSDVSAAGCDISWYLNYDALWLRRENDEFYTLSRNTFIPDFQYDFGGRYTAGRLLDCVNAWEAVFAGPFDWRRQQAVLGSGNLQSQLAPSGGYTAAEISTFNNADQHIQAWRSRLNSFEVNRRWWTWDVLSTMIGVRYIDYNEDFLFISDRSGTGIGALTQNVDNRMIGAQIGGDWLYPVSLRGNFGFRGKGGVYANFFESSTLLQNAGTTIINAGDNRTDVAGLIEFGFFGNYHIVPSIRLTAGYEFWYMPGMATVPEQTAFRVTPASGTRVLNDDEVLLHGGSVGVQILY